MNNHVPPEGDSNEESVRPTQLPKVIQALFVYPPLLDDEEQEDLEDLFDSFANAVGAKTVIEYQQVYDVTMLVWDIRRYQNVRVLWIRNQTRRAVQKTFEKVLSNESLAGAEALVKHDTALKTKKYFSDPAFHEHSLLSFEDADYSIEAEAFVLALPENEKIDRLIASAQKRLLSFLNNLEKRCATRAEKFREATDKVANGTAQP